ncbi:MAG TPA: methylenetetrahydrofolate reductase C-terminal domain-containing protein [Alphaproteobacteria bacterium]|nr:methylenetetrahydrofolate reductase C-terminal domain-containing protein [Alphaproteobacteria bacterium]
MLALRHWSVRHARSLERVYAALERLVLALAPFFSRLGHDRAEAPVAAVERRIKGLLFDCKMCGQCILGDTGMSCPMNCPKTLRNGPCGGVRPDGNCEVKPQMRCVWVAAWEGAQQMAASTAILDPQPPLDHRLWGLSSWLRVAAEKGTPDRPSAHG